jgi:hypothetical protein
MDRNPPRELNHTADYMFLKTLFFVLLSVPAWSAPETIKPFLEANCIDCHDSETHKGGLNLDDLAYQPTQRNNAATWEHVFDRVAKGEMPPKNKRQPAADEKATWLAELAKSLRSASLSVQQKEGRGHVRRLTRTEYQNTVSDLLHIHCDLTGLFPDDAVTAGFDKVGEGLTLSATHFARYQEAADKALADAIYRAGPEHFSEDGAQLFKRREVDFKDYGNWLEDKRFVLTSTMFYPYKALMGPWTRLGPKQWREADAHRHWRLRSSCVEAGCAGVAGLARPLRNGDAHGDHGG